MFRTQLIVVALLSASCGSAHKQTSTPIHNPPPGNSKPTPVEAKPLAKPVTLISYNLPTLGVVPPRRLVCHTPKPSQATARRRKARSYDFSGDILYPVSYGARVSERLPTAFKRTAFDMREAIRAQYKHFAGCYRWIRFRERRAWSEQPTLSVSFSVDPLGAVSNTNIRDGLRWTKGPNKDYRDFISCVRDGLKAMRVVRRTPRTTEVSGTLRFKRAVSGRAPKKPRRPVAVAVELPGEACVDVPARLPVDKLDADLLATITDWDQTHSELEQKLRRRRFRPFRAPRSIRVPRVMIGGACRLRSDTVGKSELRRAVRSNLGAFHDCYREALERTPGLRAVAMTQFTVLRTSWIVNVSTTLTRGDDKLRRCIEAGFRALRLSLVASGMINVRYPFRLEPKLPSVAKPDDPAAAARHAGDAMTAAKLDAERVRTSGGGLTECAGRVGVLRAMLVKAPWVYDSRVHAVAKDVAMYAQHNHKSPALASCLDEAARLLVKVATWPTKPGHVRRPYVVQPWLTGLAAATRNVERLLELWPSHPWKSDLLRFLASSHAASGNFELTEKWFVKLLMQKLSKRQASAAVDVVGHVWRVREAMRAGKPLNHCGPYIY